VPVPIDRTQQHDLHGRRRGRRLRPAQCRLIDSLLPELALELPPEGRTLDPADLFARPFPELWLEIGFGAGEHLAWQALRQAASEGPAGFIGAEFFINGIAKLLRQIEGTAARERIRIYQGDARALMAALPEGSLDRVFILFPDPWPKARHHKRRLVRRSSLERLSALLKDSGELRLATDDRQYLDWMLEHLGRDEAFELVARGQGDWRRRPSDWPPTRYEEKALADGREPFYLRFRRRPRRGAAVVVRGDGEPLTEKGQS
jgi:tRNA (guanine-N7-)-methyltransferase